MTGSAAAQVLNAGGGAVLAELRGRVLRAFAGKRAPQWRGR